LITYSNSNLFVYCLSSHSLFIGWGCNATNEKGDIGTSDRPPVDAGFQGLAALEPDGASLYLHVLNVISSSPAQGSQGDILTFEVVETSFQDLFHKADISFSRELDPVDAQRFAAASKAALMAMAKNANYTNRRRMSWTEAYDFVRLDDSSEMAAFTPGLTPHGRGLRRLHAATRELQGTHTVYNDAASSWTQPYCVMWVYEVCYWGLQYVYNYEVINWNYDVQKASSCLAQRLNVQQCDRSVTKTIPLAGSVVTCRSCYAYLGANMQFQLIFDRLSLDTFYFRIYGGAVASMDINVDFPNVAVSVSTTTMLDARRQLGSITLTVGVVPLKIEFYSTISVELSASCTTSGRIVGPGFWFENNAQVGRSYSAYSGWTDLTSAQFYMNQRAPLIDIQVNAALKARLILDMEFNIKLLLVTSLPMHFVLAPSLYADLSLNTRCTSNMITIALYSQLEGRVAIEGPSITVYGYTVGPLFSRIDSPYFTIMQKTPFACVGCSGCVSGSSAPAVTVSGGGGGGGTCASNYVSGTWSSCTGSCGTGLQTRSVVCRDCNNYASSACTGTAPATSQSCDTGITCSGPLLMYSYSSESSVVIKASGSNGYRMFTLVPPTSYITQVSGDFYTYPMFAATLQVLSGDADLYMYADNFNDPPNPPAYWPFSDRSLCGCTTGSTSLGGCRYSSQYQPTLWTTSCNIGTKTELFNMNWGTGIPYNLHLVVAGWATSSLYTLTTVYYYLLKSSYTVTVPASTATAGSKQLFQFTSSATASGFIVFATPTTSGVGDPDIYASFWNFTQFPTSSSFLISSTNEGAETMIVSDPSTFRTSASYAIMINNYVSGAYKIEVADIYTLRPGIPSPQMTLEKQNAAVYFTIRIPDCDRVSIVLTNTAGDADLYVNNKQFRSGGYNQPCNCAYKSERSGDDSIHMDWLDQTWSNDLYISVMSYSVPATFTVTVYPMFVMGEAEVYRVSTSFASSTYLLSGEGRTPSSVYDSVGHHLYDRSDCEFSTTCSVTLPSSMSTCLYGRRLNDETDAVTPITSSSKEKGKKTDRELNYETPASGIIMGSSDAYVFGARPEPSDQNRIIVEANVMALKIARKYPSCFYDPYTNAASALPGSYFFGSSTFSTGFSSGSKYKGISMSQSANGILVDSPMIASLKLTSATLTSNGQRRILQSPLDNGEKHQPSPQPTVAATVSNDTTGLLSFLSLAPEPSFGNVPALDSHEYESSANFASAPLWDVLSNSVGSSNVLSSAMQSTLYVEPFLPKSHTMSGSSRRLQSGDAQTVSIDVLSAPIGSTVGVTELISTSDLSQLRAIYSTSTCSSIATACLTVLVPANAQTSLISLKVKVPVSLVDVTLIAKTVLASTLVLVPTKVNMYSTLSFPLQNNSFGRSTVIRTPFSGKPSASSQVVIESGISKATFSNCETTYSSLNGEAAIFVDISGLSTAGGNVKVEIFVGVSTPQCPSYYWNAGTWSTCANSDCSALVGTMTRSVWCESSNGDIVNATVNTCKDENALSTSLSCTRFNSCVAPTTTTVTSGSKSALVDVMSYTARALPSGGISGPTLELPALTSGVWYYNYDADTSWRQSLSASSIGMCLELTLKPISRYSAGCGYHQLFAVYECQKTLIACLEAQASGNSRCTCYVEAKTCIVSQMCDVGIKNKGDYLLSLYQSDYSSSKVPSSCIISSLSTLSSPVKSHIQGSPIGSWQVLLSRSSASTGSIAVDSWFDPSSRVLTGSLVASANGTVDQTVFIPLQLTSYISSIPVGSSLKSITAMLRPVAEFQTKVKISPMRWDNVYSLVDGPTTLSESEMRTGGSTWLIKVQCDKFVPEAFAQLSSADAYNSFVIESFESSVSQSTEPLGWLGSVLSVLRSNQAPIAVSLIDSDTVQVTLPPIPLFRLTSTSLTSEIITINIPGRFLSSGLSQKLSATSIIIDRSSRNCIVGPWSLQETSPSSNPQYFKRVRTITSSPTGFGDACPSIEETSQILATDLDADCSFSSCGGRGVCTNGLQNAICACKPGAFGSDCSRLGSTDPQTSDTDWRKSFISYGSWSSCAPTQCSPSTVKPVSSTRMTSCILSGSNSTCGLAPYSLDITRSCSLSTYSPGVAIITIPLQISSPHWISILKATTPGGRDADYIKSSLTSRVMISLGLVSPYQYTLLQTEFTSENIAVLTIDIIKPFFFDITQFRTEVRTSLTSFLDKMILYSSTNAPISDSIFMRNVGIFKTSRSVLLRYTNATVYSNSDCSGLGTQVLDLSASFPSPSSTPSPSMTRTPTPSPSASPLPCAISCVSAAILSPGVITFNWYQTWPCTQMWIDSSWEADGPVPPYNYSFGQLTEVQLSLISSGSVYEHAKTYIIADLPTIASAPCPSQSAQPTRSALATETSSATASATSSSTSSSSATSTSSGTASSTSSSTASAVSNSPTISTSNTPTISTSNTPTISISNSPKTSSSNSPTSSISASPTISTSPSSSIGVTPSSSSIPVSEVSISLSFSNLPLSAVTNATGRASITSAIAKAAGVEPTKVRIVKVLNKVTGTTLYQEGSSSSSSSRRRLELVSVTVQSSIVMESSSKADTLASNLKSIDFASAVLTNLKASDPTTYSSVTATATVTAITPVVPTTTTSESNSINYGLYGAIGGGALVVICACSCLVYCCCCKSKKKKEEDTSSEITTRQPNFVPVGQGQPTSFGVENPMIIPFAQENPMRNAMKNTTTMTLPPPLDSNYPPLPPQQQQMMMVPSAPPPPQQMMVMMPVMIMGPPNSPPPQQMVMMMPPPMGPPPSFMMPPSGPPPMGPPPGGPPPAFSSPKVVTKVEDKNEINDEDDDKKESHRKTIKKETAKVAFDVVPTRRDLDHVSKDDEPVEV
jgi:hypothetical protein